MHEEPKCKGDVSLMAKFADLYDQKNARKQPLDAPESPVQFSKLVAVADVWCKPARLTTLVARSKNSVI